MFLAEICFWMRNILLVRQAGRRRRRLHRRAIANTLGHTLGEPDKCARSCAREGTLGRAHKRTVSFVRSLFIFGISSTRAGCGAHNAQTAASAQATAPRCSAWHRRKRHGVGIRKPWHRCKRCGIGASGTTSVQSMASSQAMASAQALTSAQIENDRGRGGRGVPPSDSSRRATPPGPALRASDMEQTLQG